MANRRIELEVLERFYYEKGGKDVIDKKNSMRRLAQETYRVAKCAIAEGKIVEGQKYLRLSLQRRCNLKVLAKLLLTTARRQIAD